jgi:hypothetical protein
MDIPDRIRDHTTIVKNHTWVSHFGCVLLRTIIGLLIANGTIPKGAIVVLCVLIIVMFSYKFMFNTGTWKVYLRTVMTYTAVATAQLANIPNANTLSGTLVIIDALMGLQSRYTATLFT